MFDDVKRVFVGRPLHTDRVEGTLLPKRVALAVFYSDPISQGPAPREPAFRDP